MQAISIIEKLNSASLSGVHFKAEAFTPRSIDGMSKSPKLLDVPLEGIRIKITDSDTINPLKVGVYMLYEIYQSLDSKNKRAFLNTRWLDLLTGSDRFVKAIQADKSPDEIVSSWQDEVQEYLDRRSPYLIY